MEGQLCRWLQEPALRAINHPGQGVVSSLGHQARLECNSFSGLSPAHYLDVSVHVSSGSHTGDTCYVKFPGVISGVFLGGNK